MTDELMTLDDIADLYQVKRKYARDMIVKRIGFPSIVPGSSDRFPRWLSSDVRDYLRGNHAKTRTNPALDEIHA